LTDLIGALFPSRVTGTDAKKYFYDEILTWILIEVLHIIH